MVYVMEHHLQHLQVEQLLIHMPGLVVLEQVLLEQHYVLEHTQ
jgi:hypothetical protein